MKFFTDTALYSAIFSSIYIYIYIFFFFEGKKSSVLRPFVVSSVHFRCLLGCFLDLLCHLLMFLFLETQV